MAIASAEHQVAGGLAARKPAVVLGAMFPYIWRNSRREQITILIIVLASLPFYFLSLDLPRNIVNDAIQGRAFKGGKTEAVLFHMSIPLPSFLGGGVEFPGVAFGRINYLMALSGVFMALVLINGAFRYVINMQKGKLGERLMRRLRLDLFTLLLRFSPEAIRTVRPAEVATIIKDEVEPVGNFVGDAFIQPAFLSGQALTALGFILVQSPSLGLIAGGIVVVQGLVIPRLRREQLRLGRQRQIRSRALAGHIGEVVDGMAEVSIHGTSAYERQKIADMLDQLFWIRYDLYGRKFMVKFINSVLAQVTPFLFYAIGGYYALRGSLDIGQLVAVIAAYKDLPPPIKELIDWEQQRLDVEVKYQQILEQFSIAEPQPTAEAAVPGIETGAIEIEGLKVRSAGGDVVLDGASLALPLGSHILLAGLGGDGATALAQVLGRRLFDYSGRVRIGGQDLAKLPAAWAGANIAYYGADTVIFQGSLRDNMLYSLRRAHRGPGSSPSDEQIADKRQGKAEAGAEEAGIDYAAAGATGADDIDDILVDLLHAVGLAPAVYGFGLARRLPARLDAGVGGRIIEARRALLAALDAAGEADLIEPFDPKNFNRNATLGENLFFGVPRRESAADFLIEHAVIRAMADDEGLSADLADLGLKIAATMVEIFSDLSGDHFLFERFSFVSASDLPAFVEIVGRARLMGAASLNALDGRALIGLAFNYTESKHRLGFVTEALRDKIVRVRKTFMQAVPADLTDAVEFYDPDRLCAAAPLRDNLLFGRIDQSIAGAEDRVLATLRRVVRDCALEREVFRFGLEQPTGVGGRFLQPGHRSAIGLARCLIKRPNILILDQPALAAADERGSILQTVRGRMAGRTLIVTMRDTAAAGFDFVVTIAGNRVKSAVNPAAAEGSDVPPVEVLEPTQDEQPEIQALRAVPMFARLDTPRLKLIAFTSTRVSFARGQTMFRQGDMPDAAYILLEGTVEVFLERPAGRLQLATIGRHEIIGEMGIINGSPRSATIVASSDIVALRLAKDIFLDLIAELPPMALAVMRDQIKRLLKSQAWLAEVGAPREPAAGASPGKADRTQ